MKREKKRNKVGKEEKEKDGIKKKRKRRKEKEAKTREKNVRFFSHFPSKLKINLSIEFILDLLDKSDALLIGSTFFVFIIGKQE